MVTFAFYRVRKAVHHFHLIFFWFRQNHTLCKNLNMSVAGKFEMISSENFGEYLKAAGVGMIQRNLAEKTKPTVEITENGDTYTIKTMTALKNTEITFKLGEEFDEDTADGRKAKTVVTKEGNKLIQKQTLGSDVSVVTREIEADKMTAVFTCKGVSSTRVYKRV